ncbi:MAG: trimethylamine methyltransferase family protein [Candidatus Thermoplasmatota archaeon]|nr:trimethylamine methyltransferase family protein [Candidatus Thermoplasmatota archaeon]
MAVAQISVLSRDEIELVHEKTLEILLDPGVRVRSEKVLRILANGGAKVDLGKMRASIPESLVNETMRRIPKRVKLCARNPAQDMAAPKAGPPYMATNGTAVYVTDMMTEEKRTSTAKDLRDLTILSDAMAPLDYVWPIVTAQDAPEKMRSLHDLAICLTNTTKHVQGEAISAAEARAQVELASVIVGGPEELAKRPIFSVIQCPICPLEFERGSVEAVAEFAEAGIPVVSMSMALMGLTSPVTLASTLAIVNAENLASFAISQLVRPGAPVIYSSESTAPNMFTGEIHYGAIEEALLAAASGQMAKRYGVVAMVGGFGAGLDGKSPGIHCDPAELFVTSATNAAATDFASGIGGLDQAKGASLEQIVIDCDIWEHIREIRRDISFDDLHFAVDLIRQVGPGGNFLHELHTARNFRKELFMPSKEKTEAFRKYMLSEGATGIVQDARMRVKEILASHEPEPIDPDAKRRMDLVLRKHSS